MYTYVNEEDFIRWFAADPYSAFSVAGLKVLFEYLELLENDTETPVVFDPVAIRCDFREVDLEELMTDYRSLLPEDGQDFNPDVFLEKLEEHTIVLLPVEDAGTYIIADV